MQQDETNLEWGDRHPHRGAPVTAFSLEESSGFFTMEFSGVKRPMHGTCLSAKPVA